MITLIITILLFIVLILVFGLLAEFFKPLDFFIKNIVVKLYEFGKSVAKSIKNISKE